MITEVTNGAKQQQKFFDAVKTVDAWQRKQQRFDISSNNKKHKLFDLRLVYTVVTAREKETGGLNEYSNLNFIDCWEGNGSFQPIKLIAIANERIPVTNYWESVRE